MAFVQIMEIVTDDVDKLRSLEQEWVAATEGRRTARREILTQDRNNPNRYVAIVFFDSYESAMENSNLPETQEFAGRFADFTTSMSFQDLDVVADETL